MMETLPESETLNLEAELDNLVEDQSREIVIGAVLDNPTSTLSDLQGLKLGSVS